MGYRCKQQGFGVSGFKVSGFTVSGILGLRFLPSGFVGSDILGVKFLSSSTGFPRLGFLGSGFRGVLGLSRLFEQSVSSPC